MGHPIGRGEALSVAVRLGIRLRSSRSAATVALVER